ncbi:MAG TPA: FixH family protein [Flavobacteriales bacterium]
MNWGKGLALALIAFAGMLAWFAVMASQHPEPLVTEDYYAEELLFQSRIEEEARARSLSAPVSIDLQRDGIELVFPQELDGLPITGTLTLLRPNGPTADLTVPIRSDHVRFQLRDISLLPGRYNAALAWEVDGVKYRSERKLYVP